MQNFIEFLRLTNQDTQNYERELVLDCANGVGAIPMEQLVRDLRDGNYLDI